MHAAVVDGRNISHQLAQRPSDGAVNEAQQQIAYADVVLLNKVAPMHQDEVYTIIWPALAMRMHEPVLQACD